MSKLTILFCMMLFAGSINAQEGPRSIEAGPLLNSYHYEEVDQTIVKGALDKETGFLPGGYISFKYQGSSLPLFGRALYEYTNSSTNYDGYLTAHGVLTPHSTTTNDIFQRIEITGGYVFTFAKNITLAPYAGYGYRSWTRTITGTGGYEEDYSWSYIPIGARSEYHFLKRWSAGVDIAVRFMVGGSLDLPKASLTMDLGSVVGFKLSFPCSYSLSKAWSVGIDPWYESSGIGKSPLYNVTVNGQQIRGLHEPDSSTSIFGVSLRGRFSF